MVIDIDGNRLDARFLREAGAIDDWFTLIKTGPEAPLSLAGFSISNGNVSARWISTKGGTYQLQSACCLGNSQWSNVGVAVYATSATTATTNSLPEGAARYYRVLDVSK
jgi:hypothetical protein